ncbi:hypothetical protein Pmar_PMAR007384 [Perkinsus marinus ATCC 50983]|uniref:Uncharacterized protein n=1 Tax=Perkinsus marinus (strain ATCC 50983 / TXsc) TaxID=423536 RepID=C5K669_PERM5|nr:hypothetical protein Pmar_PMAR007384 [Perkinsus marinus ATCC 50983]EER20099.1 hypothetical protein Pmar_PMAR007384 [Perkinsus marinus ATCC 50983]|eukprot:XP_002788303.1 hypothetical protein Pmar_PMAR007384 [Perkinsus marinus ATCC 50983]
MEYCTGARIKHTKDIPPASSNLLLGLIIDLSHGGFFITLDESRRHRLISSLTDIKTRRAKISSKLAGKLTFAAEAFLGKAGRGFIRSLIRSSLGLHVPDATLVASIESLLYILHKPNIFTRNLVNELRLTPQRLICYADATGDGNLGFFSPPSAPHQAVYGFVNMAQHYTSSRPHINILELLAGAIAVHTLSATTRPGTAFIILFLDNTVAESLIYTGSSSSSQLNHAASLFWLNVANLPIYNVFISRVSSSLNPADSVSRHDFDQPWLEDAKSIPISLPQWTLDVL